MNTLMTAVGINAKLRLSYCGLFCHATYTIAVIGAFYIYICLDYVMNMDKRAARLNKARVNGIADEQFSQTGVMLLSTVPLLGLFIMGIYSCCLLIMVDAELEDRNKMLHGQNA